MESQLPKLSLPGVAGTNALSGTSLAQWRTARMPGQAASGRAGGEFGQGKDQAIEATSGEARAGILTDSFTSHPPPFVTVYFFGVSSRSVQPEVTSVSCPAAWDSISVPCPPQKVGIPSFPPPLPFLPTSPIPQLNFCLYIIKVAIYR